MAADPHATLLRRFGIAFEPDEAGRQAARDNGNDLGEVLGTGRWELPYPSVVVIGRERVVAFADVHPDWMVRTEAAPVIEAVRTLAAASAHP